MSFNYVLRSIFALSIIIWLANVLLLKLSKYTNDQSKSIQIIERFSISKNSSLAIVKIVNHYYLMSFTEDSSEILKEFVADEVDEILDNIQSQLNTTTESAFTEMKEKISDFFEID